MFVLIGRLSMTNNSLNSPGYPDKYPNNLDFFHFVPIPLGLALNISFDDFDVQDGRRSCK